MFCYHHGCLKCCIYGHLDFGRASLGAWGENGDVRCKHKTRKLPLLERSFNSN